MAITEYASLIERFVQGYLTVEEFERRFVDSFKREPPGMDVTSFRFLDRLFSDVDSYSPNCRLENETAFCIS